MTLLLLLNIVIRIPSIPHEKGYDSFFIHSLANSVSNSGIAGWWINWMSVFGLYPYSYASAVPFTLSGMSQLTGIRMEIIILIFCIILGIFSIFTSYSLATVLYDSFIHRFIFATIYSLSAGTLNLTTWEITTRAQIIVFLPFLIYIVFQIVKSKAKFIPIFIITALLLLATHHFVYIALFYSGVIIVSSLVYKISNRYKHLDVQKIIFKGINLNYIYTSIVFLLLLFIFLYGSKCGLITEGSRYTWIIDIITITGRNLGFIFPLTVGGLTYIVFKKDKLLDEWAILICLLPTLIFSFNQTYGYMTTYLFFTLLGSVGLFNLIENQKRNNKIIIFIVIILILNVTFSSFFAHFRLGLMGGYSEWYMEEETYLTGEWIHNYIPQDKIAIDNGFETDRMVASYGGKPIAYSEDIMNYVNGFLTLDQQQVVENSPFSKEFYFDNPYILNISTSDSIWNWICLFPVTDKRASEFIEKFNVSYYYEDITTPNELFISLPENKNKIYAGGRMNLFTN